ncbi:MAG: hypothetical protein COA78_34280 [Blastopirellula sp.]|nr:MAG: hypothetical protein COA78_34280 [Blastopirellula sp.]
MFQRIITAILLLAIIVGAFQLIQAKTSQSEVKQEFDRLVAKVGRLEITDPKKFHVIPIETNEPFHYAWRVYMPEGLSIHRKTKFFSGGSSSSSTSGQPNESIFRARFRFVDDEVKVYVKSGSGSSTMGYTNKKFSQFLQDHADEMIVGSLADDGTRVFDTDQVLTLLKLEIPEHLQDEARLAWNKRDKRKRTLPPLILTQMGTQEAFAAAKEKKNE